MLIMYMQKKKKEGNTVFNHIIFSLKDALQRIIELILLLFVRGTIDGVAEGEF